MVRRHMKVREHIETVWPLNGGPDVPLVFEIEPVEQAVVHKYLDDCLGYKAVTRDMLGCAIRLAERGMPQAIEQLVIDELLSQGRHYAVILSLTNPFPCPRSKAAS